MRLAVPLCALALVLLPSRTTLAESELDVSSAEAASGSGHAAGDAWPRLRFGGGLFVGALVPLEAGDRPGPGAGVGGRIGAMFSRDLGAHYELSGLDNVIWRGGRSNALLSLNNSVLGNVVFFDRLELSVGASLAWTHVAFREEKPRQFLEVYEGIWFGPTARVALHFADTGGALNATELPFRGSAFFQVTHFIQTAVMYSAGVGLETW